MTSFRLVLFFFLFYCTNAACQNSIAGCYSSNFAIIGWFVTSIKLNEDKSFEYLFAGDLFYDKTTGTYVVNKKRIILTFKQNTDSLHLTFTDSTGTKFTSHFPKPENISANQRPSSLKIKRNKLIIYDDQGKRIRRKQNARERWKNYFLVKHQCE
ncbi:MAG: hypothetical protein RI922_2837 [Bacteroidota bacterium]